MATVKLTCPICGIEKEIPFRDRYYVYCSHSCWAKSRNGPRATNWKGGRTVDKDGYTRIHKNGTRQLEHILVAEKALGKSLPPKAVVHHIDENRTNNANTNLVICEDRSYHALLHKRMRVLKAGGDPNTDKLCCICKTTKPMEFFQKSLRELDGLQSSCRDCVSDYRKHFSSTK